jgi:hypothetical protein
MKPVYWADDDNDGGHVIREGKVDCDLQLEARVIDILTFREMNL